MNLYLLIGGAVLALIVLSLVTAIFLRRVVPANMVHIVQSGTHTVSYGANSPAGNSYYAWPTWLPKIGVSISTFPISNFSLSLNGYEAYDKGRLPFMVDIRAFFRIGDATMAAQRVATFGELQEQLNGILQGAVRRILATNELENILQDRSVLGQQFTAEVDEQLKEWGVHTVKLIEFMDIKDSTTSEVIHNIMAKEQSRIDRESRMEVAKNHQLAETAEIEARRTVDISKQDAAQQVGVRAAQSEQEIGIAAETSKQEVLAAKKITTDREMDVTSVTTLRTAEIDKDRAIVDAETYTETTTRRAAADLQATQQKAQGVIAQGNAEGEAETARLLAPVTAQAKLASDIGDNQSYQQYLVTIRNVESQQAIGVAMAAAMGKAELKVIANGGNIGEGMTNLASMLSSGGGTNLGAMLTALGQTEDGKKLLEAGIARLTGDPA